MLWVKEQENLYVLRNGEQLVGEISFQYSSIQSLAECTILDQVYKMSRLQGWLDIYQMRTRDYNLIIELKRKLNYFTTWELSFRKDKQYHLIFKDNPLAQLEVLDLHKKVVLCYKLERIASVVQLKIIHNQSTLSQELGELMFFTWYIFHTVQLKYID